MREPWCSSCGEPRTRGGRCARCQRGGLTALDWARSAHRFDGTIRHAIHRFKYGGERAWAPLLAALVAEHDDLGRPAFDLLVPVPLAAARERERGYNQAEDLTRALADLWKLEVAAYLRRTRATPPQVGLDRAARLVNVAGAFAWRGERLRGARVLLVDDVMTTGATGEACAVALKAAGAGFVGILTLARPVHDSLSDA